MKKIYAALALAVAVSASASAKELSQFAGFPTRTAATNLTLSEATINGLPTQNRVPAIDPVITLEEVCGYYQYQYIGLTSNDDPNTYIKSSFTIESTGNNTEVMINGFLDCDLTATVDVYQSTISIACPQKTFVSDKYGQISFYHYNMDQEGNLYEVNTPLVGTFHKDTKTITFEMTDICGEGLANMGGWFSLAGDISAIQTENPYTAQDGWIDAGTATFVDGWVIPAFGEDPADYPYEVPVQRMLEDLNLYRLVNPYATGPVADANDAEDPNGYIIFSIEDPTCIPVMPKINCGFYDGEIYLFPFNIAGLYVYVNGYPLSTISEVMAEGGLTWSSGAACQPSTMDVNTNVITIREAKFGITGEETKMYSWTGAAMEPVITLNQDPDGISDIVANDKAGAVEYFNLQGIRVAEPTNGNIYIRRQGNEVIKVKVVR